jgi:hypothetical protein
VRIVELKGPAAALLRNVHRGGSWLRAELSVLVKAEVSAQVGNRGHLQTNPNRLTAGSAMAVEWYVCVGGDQKGPLSTDELKRWLKEGRITPNTFVKQGAASPWKPLKHFLPSPAEWLNRLALFGAVLVCLEIALLIFADPGVAKAVVIAAVAVGLALLLLRRDGSTPQAAN